MYMFVMLRSDGSISKTDTFGTCSDIPKVAISNYRITVAMPKLNDSGDDTWTYSSDTLSQASSVEAPNAERPAKFAFEENKPFKTCGSLVKNADKWTLKLPKHVILTGCSRMNSYVKELDLNKAPLKDVAKAAGERDVEVSIACLSGGFPVITEPALPRALDVPVLAQPPIVAAPVPEPERTPAPQTAALRGPFVAEGSTIFTDLKSMIRAAVMQRAGVIIASLSPAFLPREPCRFAFSETAR